MTVKTIAFGSGNGNKEIDVIDIAALIALPGMASLLFGIFSWQVEVFGGFDFTGALWTIAGASISVAFLGALFSVIWIVATNLMNQKTDMGQYEFAGVVTALGLPILFVFVPSVHDLVMYHGISQIAAWLYVSAAAVYISYEG